MAALGEDGGLSASPGWLEGFGGDASVDTRFDASQYAFFGKDAVEEVDLGGLEDDDSAVLLGHDEEDYQFFAFGEKEESNNVDSEPRSRGITGDRGSFSREGASAVELAHEPEFSNWLDPDILDVEDSEDDKRRWLQLRPSEAHLTDSASLDRTSSNSQQQQQQSISSGVCGVSQASFHSRRPNIVSQTSGPPMPFSAPNFSSFSGSQIHLPGLPHGFNYNGSVDQFHPQDLSSSRQQLNHLSHHTGLLTWDHSNVVPQLRQQDSNDLMPPRQLSQQQQHRLPPFQPSISNLLHMPYSSPPQMTNTFEAMSGMADFGDRRWRPTQNGRSNLRFPRQFSDIGWPEFQAKYMSPGEIENILRIHHAATHSNDPYTDDYYHQACVAKRSGSSRLKHNFCPRSINDLSPRPRANSEPHAYLHIDALGRIPFLNLRRPRPLLEVDPPSASDDKVHDQNSSVKPLEQEPMLAARIIIEDGICRLLDVDDVDRLFKCNGGAQLKQRRQVLLEGLAASLQLVDPLGSGEVGGQVELEPNDDLVFLRLVSLPKGRKLLSRYLQLLFPGSELTRIVCMAIFRHLRFLFGSVPSNLDSAEATCHLSSTVASCVRSMNLSALSACLAAIVCSPEQPPLRPLGSPAGDYATVIVKSVLERVTELFTDRNSASNYSMANRALWQASFDSFFGLLTRYCLTKYDSIMQSLNMTQNTEASKAISREIPVELLRASLPHTDEQQRKILLEFAQRTLPACG